MKASLYNMEIDVGSHMGMSIEQREYDPFKTPYEVDDQIFPLYDTLREQFSFLLRYAILAPSSHNTQPWKFRYSNEGIAVYADYSRRLPVADPGNRELLMSVGAAIMNLHVAAAHFGFETLIEYNQSGDSERPLAFVRLSRPQVLSPAERKLAQLFPAITKRHTNRNPFLMARVPEQVIAVLNEMSLSGAASLFISRDGVLNQQVAGLVARVEARREQRQVAEDAQAQAARDEVADAPVNRSAANSCSWRATQITPITWSRTLIGAINAALPMVSPPE